MAKGQKQEGRRKKEPTGKETMRRRPPSDPSLRPHRFELDPYKAYSADQLSKIGAIAIKFTQLEHLIDFVGSYILFTKSPFWLKISIDKILSTRSKLELLEEAIDRAELLDSATTRLMRDTLTQFRAYRSYRNAIIHHSIYDPVKGIGSYLDESSKDYQILVSSEALTNLYSLICALQTELQEVDLLLRIETDAQRPGHFNDKTHELMPYSLAKLREQVIPELRKKLVALQTQRKSLASLPKFPDADVFRKQADEQARRSDPAEVDARRE